MKNFSGKTIVITGAGSGIGRGLAKSMALKGAALALVDLSEDSLNETANMLSDNALSIRCYPLDVSDKKAVYELADQVYKDFGRVDVVINNAGVALSETVEDMSYDDFEWVMDINFWGVVYGTKAFLPYLKRSSEAYIVNISSIFGLISVPAQSAYNASKFAVKGFTEALRLELKGTTVNPICVHPGGIKTNIAKSARFYKSIDGSLDRDEAMNLFDKFTWTTPDKAAETIINGIVKKNKRVLIGPDARIVDWFQRLLPDAYDRILGVFLNKSL
ncbi:SDR family oxidoreductase [Alkalimarinus coralli]|uniref:SDR family oxidoreductase n=1 Tax=Alkalimarinus coralli TaxID=2935863 RepID=UPI00202ADCC0|nr:SDR family oxidoreductase [Alkalimarinus coralli]